MWGRFCKARISYKIKEEEDQVEEDQVEKEMVVIEIDKLAYKFIYR